MSGEVAPRAEHVRCRATPDRKPRQLCRRRRGLGRGLGTEPWRWDRGGWSGPPRGTAVRAGTGVSHPERSTPARARLWGCRMHFLGSLPRQGTRLLPGSQTAPERLCHSAKLGNFSAPQLSRGDRG